MKAVQDESPEWWWPRFTPMMTGVVLSGPHCAPTVHGELESVKFRLHQGLPAMQEVLREE